MVERAALLVQVGERSSLGRERAVAGLLLDPSPGDLRGDVEQHREATVAQPLARDRGGHRAATQRDHCVGLVEQPRRDALLEGPEGRLAVVAEDRADRLAGLGLDLVVGVEEPPPQPLGQAHAGGRLARAHEPDQRQVAVRAGDHAWAMRWM